MSSELREVLEKLARRMGLEGDELKAWCDKREAAELEEERVQMKFEREMEKKEREIEELKLGTLQLRLQLAEQTRLLRERRERALGGSSSEPAFEVFSKRIVQGNEPLVGGNYGHRYGISPDLQLNAGIKHGSDIGSQGPNFSFYELDEAKCKFANEEHGSSTEDEFCYKASSRPSSFKEEVREPQKYDAQCRSEKSKVFVAKNLGVPLAAATRDIGCVQDHLGDSLNEERLTCWESTVVTCSEVVEENEQGLIKQGTIESQVEPAVCDSANWQNDLDGEVDRVQECTIKSVEGDLELLSVLGEEPETTVSTLARESPDESDAKTPELYPMNETEKGASMFVQGSVSKNVHTRFEAFLIDRISAETSNMLQGDPVIIGTRQTRCACGQRLGFTDKCTCGACTSTERPSLLRCKERDASQWKHLPASAMLLFKCVKCAIRLVWDAIT